MTCEELTALLQDPNFKFQAERLRAENILPRNVEFLRWLLLNGPCSNQEVFTAFGSGFAYLVLRSGYATNPLGCKGDEETNLWSLTPAGVDVLMRLAGKQIERHDKQKFERAVRRLTRNGNVVAALLKCFEAKDLAKRGAFPLSPRERNEFNTVADWVVKEGWLK